VTDADLVLGILDPDAFLGGRLALDADAARAAIAGLADRLGLSLDACAAGIVRIADEHMSDLMRSMTVRRGLDPRDFTVYAFGGGGGAHAGIYASGLGISEFVVPLADTASVWSALGVAVADLAATFEQPLYLTPPHDPAVVQSAVEELERRAREATADDARYVEELAIRRFANCKYGLQVFETEAELPPGPVTEDSLAELFESFERNYAGRFGAGAGYRDAGILVTSVGVQVHGRVRKPSVVRRTLLDAAPAGDRSGSAARDVYWEELGERVPTAIWDGSALTPGAAVDGPAVIELPDTTIVVRPGHRASIDEYGNAVVRFDGPATGGAT
jgi:N-methylhydantoinase A